MVLDQVYDRGDDESRECSPPVFNWSSEEESVDDAAKPKYKKAYLMQKLMSEKEEDEESEDEEKAKNRIGPQIRVKNEKGEWEDRSLYRNTQESGADKRLFDAVSRQLEPRKRQMHHQNPTDAESDPNWAELQGMDATSREEVNAMGLPLHPDAARSGQRRSLQYITAEEEEEEDEKRMMMARSMDEGGDGGGGGGGGGPGLEQQQQVAVRQDQQLSATRHTRALFDDADVPSLRKQAFSRSPTGATTTLPSSEAARQLLQRDNALSLARRRPSSPSLPSSPSPLLPPPPPAASSSLLATRSQRSSSSLPPAPVPTDLAEQQLLHSEDLGMMRLANRSLAAEQALTQPLLADFALALPPDDPHGLSAQLLAAGLPTSFASTKMVTQPAKGLHRRSLSLSSEPLPSPTPPSFPSDLLEKQVLQHLHRPEAFARSRGPPPPGYRPWRSFKEVEREKEEAEAIRERGEQDLPQPLDMLPHRARRAPARRGQVLQTEDNAGLMRQVERAVERRGRVGGQGGGGGQALALARRRSGGEAKQMVSVDGEEASLAAKGRKREKRRRRGAARPEAEIKRVPFSRYRAGEGVIGDRGLDFD